MLGVPVHVNIEEIRKPELDAQLIADSITQQLEKRIMFRRAMKRAMQNAMRLGAQGIKIMSAGRLNGIEIARTEWYREGRVPLHTLRADIDYGFSEAKTTYGVIGVKCWVYKGDRLGRNEAPRAADGLAGAGARGASSAFRTARAAIADPRPSGRPARRLTPRRPTETKTAEAAPAEPPKDAAAKPVVKRVRKVAAKTPGDAKPEGGAKDGE